MVSKLQFLIKKDTKNISALFLKQFSVIKDLKKLYPDPYSLEMMDLDQNPDPYSINPDLQHCTDLIDSGSNPDPDMQHCSKCRGSYRVLIRQ
jgi:hypothetical protein